MIRRLLGPLDPAGEPVISEEERAEDLARILAAPDLSVTAADPLPAVGERVLDMLAPPVHRRRRRAPAVGALAAAIAVVTAVVVVSTPTRPPTGDGGPAASSSGPAQPVLSGLTHLGERRAGAQAVLDALVDNTLTSADVPNGRYEHVVSETWQFTDTRSERSTIGVLVPIRREQWRAADDSGRVVTSQGIPRVLRAWAAPSDKPTGGLLIWRDTPSMSGRQETVDFGIGGFPAGWRERPPTDPAALADYLIRGRPEAQGPAADLLIALADLARERVLTRAERVGVLRLLATVPGLSADGKVVDGAERGGEAFSAVSQHTGGPIRYTLVVDPGNGRIVGFEQLLLDGGAAGFDTGEPLVLSYEVFLVADRRDGLG